MEAWSCNLELLSWQFKSDVRHRQPQAEGVVRPSVALCFAVALALFWKLGGCNLKAWRLQFGGLEAAIWSWFLLGSQSNVSPFPLLLECGRALLFEPWQLHVSRFGCWTWFGWPAPHSKQEGQGARARRQGARSKSKKAGESNKSKNTAGFL